MKMSCSPKYCTLLVCGTRFRVKKVVVVKKGAEICSKVVLVLYLPAYQSCDLVGVSQITPYVLYSVLLLTREL